MLIRPIDWQSVFCKNACVYFHFNDAVLCWVAMFGWDAKYPGMTHEGSMTKLNSFHFLGKSQAAYLGENIYILCIDSQLFQFRMINWPFIKNGQKPFTSVEITTCRSEIKVKTVYLIKSMETELVHFTFSFQIRNKAWLFKQCNALEGKFPFIFWL